MNKKTSLTAGLLLAGLSATTVQAETLEEALVSAYGTNPTLLSQRARLRANDELVPQAKANWRPTVSLSGAAGVSNSQTSARDSSVNYNSVTTTDNSSPRSVGLNISEPLYRGGRTTAQTKQAESTVQAERALLVAQEETVMLNAVTAYMDVLRDQAVLELNRNNEQVLQRQLEATNDRFRVGEVTRTDVAQAESRLSAAHADVKQAEGNLQASVAAYVNVMGHAPDGLKPPIALETMPDSADGSREAALAHNPNIQAAAFTYDAASYGIDLVAGELLPTVSLNGSAQRQAEVNGTDVWTRNVQGTVNVSVPIYQQGQEYSRLRQQKHVAGQRRIDLDTARRQYVEAATQSWEAWQSARARIVSYQAQIRAAEVALEGVRRESQVGSRTVLDVLNAEQELLNARVSLVQAQHDETVGAYQLRSATGSLTARDLDLPVKLYDPVEHYDEVRDKWIGTSVSPPYGDEVKN